MGRRYRFGLKTASRKEERDILRRVEALREDPGLLIPECIHGAHRIFRREERALRRVASLADDQKSLERASRRGPPLARAYAATLLLAHQGRATHLGVLPVGNRQVAYAHRGKARPEHLVAVQHYDDPWIRIVGYLDTVKRHRAHLYSSPSGFLCSTRPAAPDWYVADVLSKSALQGRDACPHVDGLGPFIEILWHSAGRTLRLCRRCDPGGNLIHQIARGIGAADPTDDLEVNVHYCPEGDCLDDVPLDPGERDAYLRGERTNAQILDAHMARVAATARERRLIVIDHRCLDVAGAVRRLAPEGPERVALEVVLRRKGFFGTGVTAAQVIQEHWDALKGEILPRVAPGVDIAPYMEDNRPPLQVVAAASAEAERHERAAAIPDLQDLPPLGRVAHDLARTYRVEGHEPAENAIAALFREADLEMKERALLLAFQRTLGLRVDGWRYGMDARDYAEYLLPLVGDLLQGPVEEYGDAMAALLAALGEDVGKGR